MADEEELEDKFTRPLDFKVTEQTYRYLLALKQQKTHGNTVTAVVRRFIDDGIQSAIDREYIKLPNKDG